MITSFEDIRKKTIFYNTLYYVLINTKIKLNLIVN